MPHLSTHPDPITGLYTTRASPEELEAERLRLAAPQIPNQPGILSSAEGKKTMDKIQKDLLGIKTGVEAAEVRTTELVEEAEAKKAEEAKAAKEAQAQAEESAREAAALGVETPKVEETPEEKAIREAQAQYDRDVAEANLILDPLKARLDSARAAQISQIQAQYARLRAAQEDANRRREALEKTIGIRTGGARYTPEHTADLYQDVVNQGIKKIGELNAEEASAIAKVQSAFDERSYDLALKEYTNLKDIRNERDKKLAEIEKTQAEGLKKQKEQTRLLTIEASISDAMIEGISDPNDIFRSLVSSGITASSKEIADAIKNLLPENKKTSDLPSDIQMFKWLKENKQLKEDATIFDFYRLQAGAKKEKGQGYGAGPGKTNISDLMFVMSALPARLKDSDAEKELIREYFGDAQTRGLNPYEMIDELTGYRVDEKTPFSEGMRNYALNVGLEPEDLAALGRLINRGENAKAIQVVEAEAYKNAASNLGENFLSEAEVRFAVEKSNEIQKTLEDFGFWDSIGPFSGTLNEAFGRLGRKKGAELKAKITFLTQEMQKRQAGSALTESEWNRILAPILPQLTDKRGVFESKIKEGKNSALGRLNSMRGQYELPTLNETQLLDRSQRITAYSSFEAIDAMTPKTITIQGQEIEVGSIVENSQGLRGRVESNGTITPLP